VPLDGDCRQEIWLETLPDGTTQRVINSHGTMGKAKLGALGGPDDTGLVLVPKGHVFVMSDNRDHAIDSRNPRHGLVPLEDVRYRVWLIHTSLDRTSRFFRPRWERFFRKVE
jgi:signal peptidase I